MKQIIWITACLLFTAESFSQSSTAKSATELAIAEQQFADDAVAHSIKEAFMKVLSEESIVFRPHPINGRWAYKIDTRPDSAYLFWKPELVAISMGGDFGYSTGPWFAKRSKNSEPVKGFGNYVTIWKKDETGVWKVVLDKGINYSMLGERPTTLVKKLPQTKVRGTKVSIEEVLAIDGQAFAGKELLLYTEESLFFRHFQYPSKLSDEIRQEVKAYSDWEPINGDVAPFGDMAYSYGTYKTIKDEKNVDGYYLRVWTRETTDHWSIVLDLRTDN